MIDNGWIMLHRKIKKWKWYNTPNTTRLFTHLLLNANYEDKECKGIIIKKGQLLTGRKILAAETGLTEQQVRTSLIHLQSPQQINQQNVAEITIKSTNKYSIITICNYSDFQCIQSDESPTKRRSNNQQNVDQLTTTKEINNKINKKLNKKEYGGFSLDYFYEKVPLVFNGAIETSPKTPRILKTNALLVRKNIRERMKDKSFKNLEQWRQYFEFAMRSEFLTTHSFANFNWLTNIENLDKVRAGSYHEGLSQDEKEWDNEM